MLLVLDNFEQLLPAASLVGDLLRRTSQLKLVVTSRAGLRLSGEQEYSVPPLELPGVTTRGDAVDSVAGSEAVRLFVERAQATLPDFQLSAKNAAAVAQIVTRLDGLPLAIELAAARIKLLPPEMMLTKLDSSLGLLVARTRDLPDRQQTLRSTIAWSYELLSPNAQRLLAICSVFRGGASFEHIQSIADAAGFDELDLLSDLEELVDHSLMRRTQTRFMMLETIREFAAERLSALPEERAIRQQHAQVFLDLVETAQYELTGRGELEWLERMDLEHNNIRAAMDWFAVESPPMALRMEVAMRPFWSARGHFTEGRQRLCTLLDRVTDRTETRVRALNAEGWLAVDQGDYADAEAKLNESISLSRALGDRIAEAVALAHLGRAKIASGRPAEAVAYLDEALPVLRSAGEPADVAVGLLYWGLCAIFNYQPEIARERLLEGVQDCRKLGFESLGARAQLLLSYALIDLGELDNARAALREALATSMRFGDYWIIPQQMSGFAGIAAKSGRLREALRFVGFARALSKQHDFSIPIVAHDQAEKWIAPARRTLGAAAEAVMTEGAQLTLEQAAAAALATDVGQSVAPQPALTARELEVARLVAQGMTNRQVADQLYLSVRTVDVHVDQILTKLGFNSRMQLARWAYETQIQNT